MFVIFWITFCGRNSVSEWKYFFEAKEGNDDGSLWRTGSWLFSVIVICGLSEEEETKLRLNWRKFSFYRNKYYFMASVSDKLETMTLICRPNIDLLLLIVVLLLSTIHLYLWCVWLLTTYLLGVYCRFISWLANKVHVRVLVSNPINGQ